MPVVILDLEGDGKTAEDDLREQKGEEALPLKLESHREKDIPLKKHRKSHTSFAET